MAETLTPEQEQALMKELDASAATAPVQPLAPEDQTRVASDLEALILEDQSAQPQSAGEAALSTAADIGQGVIEAPASIVRGVADAAKNSLSFVDDVLWWANDNIAGFDTPKDQRGGFADFIPEVKAKEETVTGNLIRGVASFMTAFVPIIGPAGKVAEAAKLAGAAKVIGQTAGAGFIADFLTQDPNGQTLSNAWQNAGLPQNVLTDFLAASPEDKGTATRLKAALEGLGVGTALDGLMRGFKIARKAVQTNTAPAQAFGPEFMTPKAQEAFVRVGNDAPAVVRVPEGGQPIEALGQAADSLGVPVDIVAKSLIKAGKAGTDDVYLNLSHIETPEQVKKTLASMADAFAPTVNDAKRGVQSWEDTKALADQMGMTVDDLLYRRRAKNGARMPFTAEESLGAQRLLTASAENLAALAKAVADPNSGDLDVFAFNKAFTVHQAIQAEVMGSVAETARSLNAMRIPRGSTAESLRAVKRALDADPNMVTNARQLAAMVTAAAESGLPVSVVNKMVQKAGPMAATMAAAKQVFINGILSGPATHLVNVASNGLNTVLQVADRAVASRLGIEGGPEAIETAAMSHALIRSQWDAMKFAWMALKEGRDVSATGQFEGSEVLSAISDKAFGIPRNKGPFTETLVQAVNFTGQAIGIPGRLLAGADTYFKTIGYRMEVHALAARQAMQEGLTGEALSKRIGELTTNPPENIRLDADEFAHRMTFTEDPGKFVNQMIKLRGVGGDLNPLTFFVPFIRTPTNILRNILERSPFAFLVSRFRDDMAAGGARQALAISRMATGTVAMGVIMDAAERGLITGKSPGDPGERDLWTRQGKQEYAVKLGDRWVQFSRLDPVGGVLGVAADLSNALKNARINPDDVDEWQEISAAMIASISQTFLSKSYVQGVVDLMDTLNDPERYSESMINSLTASFMPFSSLSGTIERAVDPEMRFARDPFELMQSRIAGLSERLQVKRDIWGNERRTIESGFGDTLDAMNPVRIAKAKDDPVDAELARLEAPIRAIREKTSFGLGNRSAEIDLGRYPEVLDEYIRLSGNELKIGGLGLHDYLTAVVTGKHPQSEVYARLSDGREGGKAQFIDGVVERYRKAARAKILTDERFSEFRADWDQAVGRKSAERARTPEARTRFEMQTGVSQ